jgi:DNA-binding transcriptional LysR family regulator
MDFRELEYVVSIAKHQRVGKAAEECCITQPAMSKFIQNLEYNLGQPLFRRLGNKFLLTYAGERYVETAKLILETEKRLEKELSDIVREDIGEMKIAFRLCGGINVIPEVLSVFWKQYPRVKIKIHEDNSGVIENELLNGDIDLAFITLPFKHPDVSTKLISKEEFLLVMSGNHPMVDKASVKDGCKYPWMDINILKDESFILPWPTQRTRQMADKIFRDAGIKPNVLLTVRNTDVMIELAAKGFGIAFVGEAALRHVPKQEKLCCFSVGSPNTEFSLAVALRSEMYQPTYIKHFINIARNLWDFDRGRQPSEESAHINL